MTARQPTPRWTLYHDSDCMLCRTLAAMVASSEIEIAPLPEGSGDIALETPEGVMLSGIDAWVALQGLHPALQSWAWLARKLGMDDQQAATVVQRTAHGFRGLCRKCKPLLPATGNRVDRPSRTHEGESR